MDRPHIIVGPEQIIDTIEYESRYGVNFTAVTDNFKQEFGELAIKLAKIRSHISSDNKEDEVASYSIPTHFLSDKLSTESKTLINTIETQKVAEYALSVQSKLAEVPIVENWERMSSLTELFGRFSVKATFSETPFHDACGEWAGKRRQYWTRESFASRLVTFGKLMNGLGVGLHVEDAFRPVGVQEGLFKRRVEWTKRDYPGWSLDQIIDEAKSKTAVKPRLASHKAGAAIDARLRELKSGELLDFGHDYPDGGAIVFPKTPFVTREQWVNRQIFSIGSQLSGLTLYVGEDWHVSYGDNLASIDHEGNINPDYIAKYGPIKRFGTETDPGKIVEVYEVNELDKIFDIYK